MRTADPGTNPPPHTRSNSAMPVARRGGNSSGAFRSSSANGRPFARARAPAPTGIAPPSSTIVFQPPHASQRPDHFAVSAPQDWQTNDVWTLALSTTFSLAAVRNGKGLGRLAAGHWTHDASASANPRLQVCVERIADISRNEIPFAMVAVA